MPVTQQFGSILVTVTDTCNEFSNSVPILKGQCKNFPDSGCIVYGSMCVYWYFYTIFS